MMKWMSDLGYMFAATATLISLALIAAIVGNEYTPLVFVVVSVPAILGSWVIAWLSGNYLRNEHEPGRSCPAHRASTILENWSLLLPPRMAKEEIGDALEDIHRRLDQGQPSWKLYLRVGSTIFWTGIYALTELLPFYSYRRD